MIYQCTVCGDFAVCSWRYWGKVIASCYRHLELLNTVADIRQVYNYDNGPSSWSAYGEWSLPLNLRKR